MKLGSLKVTRLALQVGLVSIVAWGLAPANANTNLWCQGTLSNHWINSSGTVYVVPSWRGDHVALCNLNSTNAAGITPTVCAAWTSIIRAAMQRSAQTIIYYGGAPVATCGSMPTYDAAPSPIYVMII
jgi:hypothetical protein